MPTHTNKKSNNKKKGIRSIRFRQSLFWDVDTKTIDTEKHAKYIIERILDFGNDKEVRWMYRTYSHNLIRDALKTSRVIRKKSKTLWELILQTQ